MKLVGIRNPFSEQSIVFTTQKKKKKRLEDILKKSVRGLMIFIATGFIPLSPLSLSIVSTMVIWESSQWLGKNIVQSTGKKNPGKQG